MSARKCLFAIVLASWAAYCLGTHCYWDLASLPAHSMLDARGGLDPCYGSDWDYYYCKQRDPLGQPCTESHQEAHINPGQNLDEHAESTSVCQSNNCVAASIWKRNGQQGLCQIVIIDP